MKKITGFLIIMILLLHSFSLSSALAGQEEKAKQTNELPLILLGTVQFSDQIPLAIIQDKRTLKKGLYSIAEEVSGYKITAIRRGKVVLLKKGKLTTLEFPFGAIMDIAIPLSDTEKIINKQAALKKIPTLQAGLKLATPLPFIENGKIQGIKVTNVRDAKFFEKIGVKEGDVILKVNGEKIDSWRKPFELYHRLKNEDTFTLEVMRQEKVRHLTYYIN
ncbi:MAG: PDZ domain-containing protein [Elusimicrobia bacterium]|nr:PDZ domain-containing protein [Elusimicrobiota bacterium]